MLKNLFYNCSFIIQYILGNKIKAITLVDIYTIKFGFIDEKVAKIICQRVEIKS